MTSREFVENMDLEPLFQELRRLVGMPDLKFTHRITEDRYGNPVIRFESDELVEHVGFLKLMFSSIKLAEFNSEYVEKGQLPFYWLTVSFRYTHPSGGSNGCTILCAVYRHGTWEFDRRG